MTAMSKECFKDLALKLESTLIIAILFIIMSVLLIYSVPFMLYKRLKTSGSVTDENK